ncbi:MAG: hypothetical protein ABSG43_00355 [Solirubrobacteraceae bacterium]|jgi:hypothetical protein
MLAVAFLPDLEREAKARKAAAEASAAPGKPGTRERVGTGAHFFVDCIRIEAEGAARAR